MCEIEGTNNRLSRRSLLKALAAGSAGAVAAAAVPGVTASAAASTRHDTGTPRHPFLPVTSSQPQGSVLTLLGTAGGPQADYVRAGASSVLTVDGHNYVVDAGRSSVTQYINAGLLFGHLEAMFISHLHADHLADYYNYFLLEGGAPNAQGDNLTKALTVYGPGPAGALPDPIVPGAKTIAPDDPTPGITDLTNKLTEGYAYSHNIFIREDGIRPVTDLTDVHDIVVPDVGADPLGDTAPAMAPFRIYQDDRVDVHAILVPHGYVYPAFAFRFDTAHGSVAFSGDTKESDNIVTLAQGADVLVHEVLDYEFFVRLGAPEEILAHFKRAHTLTTEIGSIAERAGVGKLVLNHLIPSNPAQFSDAEYLAKASQGYTGPVHVGNDLDRIALRRTQR